MDHEDTREADGERIGRSYYDDRYFNQAQHLVDPASRFQRYRTRMVLRLLAPDPSDHVLDMGCGWGTITFSLAPAVRTVVGIDFSQQAIDHCRARLHEESVDNVSLRLGEAQRTGLEAATFDAVVAADLFEHLYPDDSEDVAAEAFRLLRPGGRLAVWTPCPSHILEVLRRHEVLLKPDPGHVDYKSLERMVRILQAAGFVVVRAGFSESHLPGLRLIERVAQRWVPLLRRRVAVLAMKPGPVPHDP